MRNVIQRYVHLYRRTGASTQEDMPRAAEDIPTRFCRLKGVTASVPSAIYGVISKPPVTHIFGASSRADTEQGHYRTTGTRGKGKVWSIERRIEEVAGFLICPRDRSTSLLNPSSCSLPTSLSLLSLWSDLPAAWGEIVLSETRRDIIIRLTPMT